MVCAVLCVSPAFGQIKPAEQTLQRAFETLRGHAGLQVTLDGTQQIGDTTTAFKTVTYWFSDIEDGRPMTKMEMIGYVNGSETFKLVGDGVTLWTYDKLRNEYSSSRYGNYRGEHPKNYVSALLATVRSYIKGQASYPIRLLGEVYGGEGARYTSWMPGTTIEDNGQAIRYMLGSPVRRRLEFWYTNLSPSVIINHIDFSDQVSFGSSTRDIDWSMSPVSFDVMVSAADFEFVPPPNSRAVVGVRPVTGG
ncbi:MAG: hypothetical protein QOJ65_985 [Fimbriimonadaceae bacterium]|jgi:hypothetical protein|nr:hypothetical protein [Fimbriimonadaceae bacterium]